jgi:glutathione peroxidase-family protein
MVTGASGDGKSSLIFAGLIPQARAGFFKTKYSDWYVADFRPEIIEKTSVKGENKCELYQWLTNPKKNGWNSKEPAWNFCKYLIDEKGFLVAYYPSHVVPSLSS